MSDNLFEKRREELLALSSSELEHNTKVSAEHLKRLEARIPLWFADAKTREIFLQTNLAVGFSREESFRILLLELEKGGV